MIATSSHNLLQLLQGVCIMKKHEEVVAKESINFLCFDLSRFSKSGQFISLSIITFAFFLLYAYLYELIFKLPGVGKYPWFFTLYQFFLYAIFASVESVIRNERQRKIPLKSYLLLALLAAGTMGFAAQAMPYLNYPTQVLIVFFFMNYSNIIYAIF